MTVRIGTGSAAVDPAELRVAGMAPSKIMLGTGSSSVEVWTAIITVTPQAPTFLAASPWYTLPTQAGVTYTVSGTPGYSQTVTVTATAQPGYALVGTSSWTHTYGPPPRYVASGQYTYPTSGQLEKDVWATPSTHTVVGGGIASGRLTVEWTYAGSGYGVRVLLNGEVIAVNGPPHSGSGKVQSVDIPETYLSSGDMFAFQMYATNTQSFYRRLAGWSWYLS